MKNYKQIVLDVLRALGFADVCYSDDEAGLEQKCIKFRVSGISDKYREDVIAILRIIIKDNLSEFFYVNDYQFIYFKS